MVAAHCSQTDAIRRVWGSRAPGCCEELDLGIRVNSTPSSLESRRPPLPQSYAPRHQDPLGGCPFSEPLGRQEPCVLGLGRDPDTRFSWIASSAILLGLERHPVLRRDPRPWLSWIASSAILLDLTCCSVGAFR